VRLTPKNSRLAPKNSQLTPFVTSTHVPVFMPKLTPPNTPKRCHARVNHQNKEPVLSFCHKNTRAKLRRPTSTASWRKKCQVPFPGKRQIFLAFLWPCGRFEAESFGRFGRPFFVAEWKSKLAINRGPNTGCAGEPR